MRNAECGMRNGKESTWIAIRILHSAFSGSIALIGAIAVLAILYLKYAPNQNIAWPIATSLLILAISVIVALAALLTLLDLLTQSQVVADAWTYFRDVQTKNRKYKSFLSPTDQPPTFLNADIMAKYRPAMRAYYYNPSKYGTYLEQLGIKYPTIKPKSATH